MKDSLTLMIFISLVLSIIVLLSRQKHLLLALLSLEAIMISIITLIPILMNLSYMLTNALLIPLLTYSACEASLGLSLMISMSRTFGSDLVKSLLINKC